ncbi:hypothetical protein [Streptomyces cavernicola]|uniref:Tetracyclin repressor SlmA-like C-terminal domain-containing protein n=1 Tax=Streptomyces cavernicola TaxID=3043613 RepID=A0ABT6SJJ5_9ACTN|nr:hypothetical protein [Streptomyces sp. B-S-A6]MDI3408135.1 hypothetical protein [Streptomyces sp. B-S-A6]
MKQEATDSRPATVPRSGTAPSQEGQNPRPPGRGASQSEHHLHALRRRIRDLGAAYLAGRAPGERTGATRSWVIVAAMEALSVRWVLERPAIPRELLVEELTALVTNYMAGGARRTAGERNA